MTKFWLAEDDPDDTDFFCEALKDIDRTATCVCAANGAELVEKIDRGIDPPEMIFLDANMPQLNGWETLCYLKNKPELKEIPTIIYSTSFFERDAVKAIRLGALCFYEKPTNYLMLKEFLNFIMTSESLNRDQLLDFKKINQSQKIFT